MNHHLGLSSSRWDDEVGSLISKALSSGSGAGNVLQHHHQGGLVHLVYLL